MYISHIDEISSKRIENEVTSGVTKQVLVSPEQGWGDYVMRRFVLDAGGYAPKHSHPWPHIVYVLEGEGVLFFEGEEHPLSGGSVSYVPSDTLHQIRALSDNGPHLSLYSSSRRRCVMDREVYDQLLEYVLHLDTPKENTERLQACRPYFDSVTSDVVMALVDDVMKNVDDIEKVKILVTRMIHSFSKGINREKRPFPRHIDPIEKLLERNDLINEQLALCSDALKMARTDGFSRELRTLLDQQVTTISQLISHYQEKEYRLFPLVEKFITEHRCVQLMWAIHDDIRKTLTELSSLSKEESSGIDEYNKAFGALFFDMKTMIMREEQILFPEVIRMVPENALLTMNEDQLESGKAAFTSERDADEKVDLLTGNPTLRQIVSIFNNLPVDITFIDENDEVVFFSTPDHRVFHRSKGIIGRNVKNCHPPKSLHVVEKILAAFKAGTRDTAEFFIVMNSQKIRIEYRAIRNEEGVYKGTLEITQEISHLQELTEPKRLLDWD